MADILGYTNLITDNQDRDAANAILVRLNEALSAAYAELEKWGGDSSLFDSRTFTDNVVVGCPVRYWEDAEAEMGLIFMAFAAHEARLAADGFFLRGGIAVGDMYMNETLVFGFGLYDAHSGDQKGEPPRLRLTDSALALAYQHLGDYAPGEPPHTSYLVCDSEGVAFLNYLYVAFEHFPDAGPDFELLQRHRDEVIRNLTRYAEKDGTHAKYWWVAQYHNWVLGRFAHAWDGFDPASVDEETGAAIWEAQKVSRHLIPDVPSGSFTAFGAA